MYLRICSENDNKLLRLLGTQVCYGYRLPVFVSCESLEVLDKLAPKFSWMLKEKSECHRVYVKRYGPYLATLIIEVSEDICVFEETIRVNDIEEVIRELSGSERRAKEEIDLIFDALRKELERSKKKKRNIGKLYM